MRLACIIQARLGSTRFPGKVLAKLGGKPVLDWVVEAAARIPRVNEVRVAWPGPHEHEDDVLSRYWRVAGELGWPDAIMRVTGDCPLLDPHVSSLVVEKFLGGGAMYVSNIWPVRTWPDGLDTEVFTLEALRRAHEGARDLHDREHVTPWMQRNLVCLNVPHMVDWSRVRLTLDTPEDLRWLEQVLASPRS